MIVCKTNKASCSSPGFSLSLVGFNDAFNTIRLYKRPGCLQTAVLSGNHKTKSAALFRLLTRTIGAPKKRYRIVRVTNTQKWERRIERKLYT